MSNILRQLRARIWGKPATPPRPLEPVDTEELFIVPEIIVADLQQALTGKLPPFLLDIREPYEWRQVHMPAARHIPMNEVPHRLAELPRDQMIVVICAHGSRSYDVAGYLIEQGYQANSLAGGISAWARTGGEIRAGGTQK